MAKNHRLNKNIIKHTLRRRSFSKFLRILGPGIVSGAADDDPSGVVTYSQAGAKYGFGFLWAFPFMYPMLIAVQESCSRIGAVTGKGLATIIKDNFNKKLLFLAVLLVVVANTINIGADLGAMASTTQLFIGLPFEFLAIFYAIFIILMVIFVKYKTYARILKWLAVSLLAYPIAALLAKSDWLEVIKNTFTIMPVINSETVYIFVGIIGTTISPYLFFWDTSEVVEEEISNHRLLISGGLPKISKKFLRNLRIDNFLGMTLSVLTGWFIVVLCASVLNGNNITNIDSAADAAKALEPLVSVFPYSGLIAKLIFSIGILGIGLLAVPILAGSSAYAISEVFGWREGLYRKFNKAIGFYAIIIVATIVGLLINFIGINPIQALIFTAVFNGVAAVPLLWMIFRIGNDNNIMGQYKNGWLSKIFISITILIMTVAVLALFYFIATDSLMF